MTQPSPFKTVAPLALAAGFAFFGVQKFGDTNLIFEIIAQRSGINLFEPVIRRLTGLAELGTAILFLVPNVRVRLMASFSAAMILFGAIGFHLSPWLGINVPGIGHGLFLSALGLLGLTWFYVNRVLISPCPTNSTSSSSSPTFW